MKSLMLTLVIVSVLGPLQSFAANPATPAATTKKPDTGDIDMNQFNNLDNPSNPEKIRDKKIKVQMTCTDPQGHTINKGESGFETCLSNRQTPVMNQPRTAEPDNDIR